MNKEIEVIESLKKQYNTGENYVQEYLKYWYNSQNREMIDLQEIQNLEPPESIWFEFAMSTNWRGNEIAQSIRCYIPQKSKKYLDIGCGFGGFLIAFSKLGLEVTGIEIDHQRIILSRANCKDHQLFNCVFFKNILDEDIDTIGKFDVITCIDVIEHVSDVKQTFTNIDKLLNKDGTIFLEIPNKDSIEFVTNDGHFKLFGITLLHRDEAIQYHKKFFNFKYDVGEYYTLDYYLSLLKNTYSTTIIKTPLCTPYNLRQTPILVAIMWKTFFQFVFKKRVTFKLKTKISFRFLKYNLKLLYDFIYCIFKQDSRQRFINKYLTNFWSVIAKKDSK